MKYTIHLSEIERNKINKTLRDKAEITNSPQDRQAAEAFIRGSIDNTFDEIGEKIITQRKIFYQQ